MTILKLLFFLLSSLTLIITAPLSWSYFYLLPLLMALQWPFLHSQSANCKFSCKLGWFPLSKRFSWEDILNLRALSATSEFYVWVYVRIGVYIAHRKYQFKFHSSQWFSAPYAATIAHRDRLFSLHQKKEILCLKPC